MYGYLRLYPAILGHLELAQVISGYLGLSLTVPGYLKLFRATILGYFGLFWAVLGSQSSKLAILKLFGEYITRTSSRGAFAPKKGTKQLVLTS